MDAISYDSFRDRYDSDDLAIQACHQYANKHQVKVIQRSGDFYLSKPLNISIQTDVDWGQTVFHVDERNYSQTQPFFVVEGPEKSYQLEDGLRDAFIKQLKDSKPHFSSLSNCLVVITDETSRVGHRQGRNETWPMQDFYYIDYDGHLQGNRLWSFDQASSVEVYPCPETSLKITGGKILLNGQPTPFLKYVQPFIEIRRSFTEITYQFVDFESGAYDRVRSPLIGFYRPLNVYKVKLSYLHIPARQAEPPYGSYSLGGQIVIDYHLDNIVSTCKPGDWGVMGTNLLKDVLITNCHLNRIDTHFIVYNLSVMDTVITDKGILLNGGGQLILERVTSYAKTNRLVEFRQDYGGIWQGNINIKDCRLVVRPSFFLPTLLAFMTSGHDYKLPQKFSNQIDIENVMIDYSQTFYPFRASLYKISWVKRSLGPDKVMVKNLMTKGFNFGVSKFDYYIKSF